MLGNCKFCGQSMVIDYDTFDCEMAEKIKEGMSPDDIATMNCKCEEGRRYRNIEDMKTEAKSNAEALFKIEEVPFPDEKEEMKNAALLDLMDKIIDSVAAGIIKKATLKLDERTTALIQITPKDGIRTKKKLNAEYSLDANHF